MDLCCCFCSGPPEGRFDFLQQYLILDSLSGGAMAGINTGFKFLHFACCLEGVPLPASVLVLKILD